MAEQNVVVLVNGRIWGSELFEMREVKELFKGLGIRAWLIEDDEDEIVEYEFEEGLQLLCDGECVVKNKELCEMGDDFCEISIEFLKRHVK